MTYITLSTDAIRRVHITRPGTPLRPVCGIRRSGWQTDIGPATCERCKAITMSYGYKLMKLAAKLEKQK